MKSDFTLAFNEIVEMRALPKEKVLEALSQALVSAYRRDARVIDAQRVEADIDAAGTPRLLVEKEVVHEVHSPQTEITITEAHEIDPSVQEGDMIMAPVTTLSKSFGRIAAQTAKQVILQHIREAERESLYHEYIEREGDLITGTIRNVSGGTITLDLGRTEAVMPQQHRIPNERYHAHDKIRVYIVEVKKSNRGPQIIASRNHKNMLRRLMEYEVPEIWNGQIEIKNIAREAGHRSKVAVMALQDGIDAVGACVGMRGMRIQNIVKELNDEKIDIIEWDADPAKFIARALSPARVTRVFLEEEIDSVRTATVIVPEDQLSLAIGREGQNARLAAKLTGWRIDIKSVIEAAQVAISNIDEMPLVLLQDTHPELVTEANRILDKKAANRAVTPEEYASLQEFVELAEGIQYELREEERQERRESIESVRPLVPPAAFDMPLVDLELAEDIMRVIDRLGNVGELWVRFMSDEEGLEVTLKEGGAGDDAMDAIRDALDDLVLPQVIEPELDAEMESEEIDVEAEAEIPEPVAEPEAEVLVAEPEPVAEAPIVEVAVEEAPVAEEVSVVAEEAPPTAETVAEAPADAIPRRRRSTDEEDEIPDYELFLDDFTEEDEDEDEDIDSLGKEDTKKKKKGKKAKNRRRQLIYDEDIGEVVAKRRRKRGGDDLDEYEEFF